MTHPINSPLSQPAVVAVVGTLNVDFIWQVPELPRPGHTVLATGAQREFGGKGANQAVAAARHGARVSMIGTVGDDAEGRLYREHLHHEGIDPAGVATVPGVPTGSAQVVVNAAAENLIVVHAGANGRLDAAAVTAALDRMLPRPGAVVTQLESPLVAAVAALRWAAQHRVRSILNASPVRADFPWGVQPLDVVVLNEHECAACFGHTPDALTGLTGDARQTLLATKGVRHLVVTQGSEPTLRFSAAETQSVPTHPVQPRDTVGAGDTFAGVLATRLAEGSDWDETLRHANVAAALSTLAPGAQAAMPARAVVEAASRQRPDPRGGSHT
ncbi:MAG: ribokinase [Opitutaceae bacterium]|nr:ribokinase [Opitutaceae bacterium]